MNPYTFKFFGGSKHLNTRTFHAASLEDAYKKADAMLRQNKKYDDWEYIPK